VRVGGGCVVSLSLSSVGGEGKWRGREGGGEGGGFWKSVFQIGP